MSNYWINKKIEDELERKIEEAMKKVMEEMRNDPKVSQYFKDEYLTPKT